ncbi:nucleotidyltransferase family protein [Uliginosibacterium sp. 31-12]|uniref:nucleotidyltransferase family protein n=1 Tax=Uliginosibacterium sp. 31-12 TaxID=3062781 RepID=UPI0026E45C4E|nr:nucleotidyltransferase family protein [Uliginosibacterium sp. 31-12]MDO6386889.1 nucleotidyltransferase family protein [Uliginosibacterium sp. 31-12]
MEAAEPIHPGDLNDRFLRDVLSNRHNRAILDRWNALALPDAWLVAGCLFQTVWNLQAGHVPESNIKDYDLFYFDPSDLSETGELRVQAHADEVLGVLGITIEVANQARVHLWYESHFGQPYAPLRSSREGIDRFLMPSTCVGIRPGEVYAPNGLQHLYDGILSPNPLTPYPELFERKAASYRSRWPGLRIRPHPAPC